MFHIKKYFYIFNYLFKNIIKFFYKLKKYFCLKIE